MKHNTKIMAVVNQKGGVGKTTTATNLATALAAIYKKTLLIDLDPQGNASTGLGIDQRDRKITIYEVLISDIDISAAVVNSNIPNLNLIPSNVNLSAAELELLNFKNRDTALKEQISKIQHNYDYIIIDCPPSLSLLTINALTASTSVVVPLQCEFFALEGLTHLMKTINLIKKRLNPRLDIEGIVLTMHDKRNKINQQIESEVRSFFGDAVFSTVIPRNIRLSEAPSHGTPAIIYDHACPGSMAYIRLAKELLEREKELI